MPATPPPPLYSPSLNATFPLLPTNVARRTEVEAENGFIIRILFAPRAVAVVVVGNGVVVCTVGGG